jgi:hypothetical protein
VKSIPERYCWLLTATLLLFASPLLAADGDTFSSRSGGFSIRKPPGWHFLQHDQVRQTLAVPRLRDASVEAKLRQGTQAPIVIIAKYPEPHTELNPSIQVRLRTIRPGQNADPVHMMESSLRQLRRSFRDLELVDSIQETTVSNHPAAVMSAKYTVADPRGREMKTWSRTWLVPRSDYVVLITMAGAQEGADVAEAEFAQVLSSINLDPTPVR